MTDARCVTCYARARPARFFSGCSIIVENIGSYGGGNAKICVRCLDLTKVPGERPQMGTILFDRTDIMFLETLLIFAGLCAMSIISFLFLHGHFKVNTSFRGYTVQIEVLKAKIEMFMSKSELRRSISRTLKNLQ